MSKERGIAGHATVTARGHFGYRRRCGRGVRAARAADHAADRAGRAAAGHVRHHRQGRRRAARAARRARARAGAGRRLERRDRRRHRPTSPSCRLANTEITVYGDVVRAEAGALWDDVVVTSLAHGLGGLECLSGIPGSAGATPGAERRRLRRRGGRRHQPGPAARPSHRGRALGRTRRAGLRLPHQRAEELVRRGGARGRVRTGRRRTAARRCGTASWRMRLAPNRIRASSPPGSARRCWRCGRARAWCSTMPTTTPGASARSSPTRSSRRPTSTGCVPHVGGEVPNYPAPDGVKLAAGWLVERAGFGRGYPGPDAPARLSTKHALAVTNRGAATTADVLALARTVRDGCAERIRDRTHTRADSGWVRTLGTVSTRDHQPAPSADRNRRGRLRRARCLRR